MKKITLFTGLVLCFAAMILSGCEKKNTPEPETVILNMEAEGLKVLMSGSDIERTFSIVAAENVAKDVFITVTSDGKETEAVVDNTTLKMAAGSNSVSGKIKFLADAFPLGTPAKNIKLSAECKTAEFETNAVTYSVSGADKPLELPTATFHCDETEVYVSDEYLNVPVTIKLDKAAEQYTEFTIVYGPDNTVSSGSWIDMYPPYIDEGEKEVTFNVVFDNNVFKPGVSAVAHNRITSESAKIGEPSSVKFTVTGLVPNKAALSTDGLDVVVGDNDFEKTITVTLDEAALAETVFTVVVESEEGGFEIVDKTITIAKGEKTGTGVIKFLKKSYPIELMTGTATVSISTDTQGVSTADAGNLVFNIKGTGTAPMASFENAGETDIVKIGSTDKTYNFVIELSEPIDNSAVINITAESDKEGSYTVNNPSLTVIPGSTSVSGSITFKHASFPYDTDKANVKLKISSDDIIIINSGSFLNLKVSGQTVNPNKEDMKYTVPSSYDVYVSSTGVTTQMIYVSPEVYGTKNTKENNIDAVITGGKEGVDYELQSVLPVTINAGSGYTYIYVNVLPAAAGKTLTVEIMSDEATVSTANKCQLRVAYVEWPPVNRSAPKVKSSTAWGDYGVVFKKVVGPTNDYTFTLPRQDWEDYYDNASITVPQGESDVKLIVVVPSDSYYMTRTFVAVYADFNNDGNFSGSGEKVYLSKVEGLTVGTEKEITVRMNVPADAASEFPVRMGTIISNGEIGSDFADGYFLLPGAENLIQMADFKFVKQ